MIFLIKYLRRVALKLNIESQEVKLQPFDKKYNYHDMRYKLFQIVLCVLNDVVELDHEDQVDLFQHWKMLFLCLTMGLESILT